MSDRTLEEFLAVVARAIGAQEAFVVDAAAEPPPDAATVRCDLPGQRRLVARLAAPASDAPALQRRLEMVAETFIDLFPREPRVRPSRPPPSHTLRDELSALAQRAGASDALIIDAHSPVVWATAAEQAPEEAPPSAPPISAPGETPRPPAALHAVGPEDVAAVRYGLASAQGVRVDPVAAAVVPRAVCARHRVLPIARDGDRLLLAMADPGDVDAIHDIVLITGLDVEPVFAGESMAAFFQHLDDVMASLPAEVREARSDRARASRDTWARTMRARRAIADVRGLPEMPTLHKGGHLRHQESEPTFGYVARSFAAIYVLVLVYDRPFEELLAKRAITQALPTIERLVAALPPLSPTPPTAGVAAMATSRGRRRR